MRTDLVSGMDRIYRYTRLMRFLPGNGDLLWGMANDGKDEG